MKVALILLAIFSAALAAGNPYDLNTHEYFVNPWFENEVDASKTLSQNEKDAIRTKAAAFWVDTMDVIQKREPSLKTLLSQASERQKVTTKKVTVTYIHYDLPNRDCAAKASNGEICCSGNKPDPSTGACDDASYHSGDCSKGLALYKQYTDEVVSVLKQFPNIEIVAIIEPDSLPNLATNLDSEPHCTQTTKLGYLEGVKYALKSLSAVSNINMYIDAAHGGWLGWCGTHQCGSDNECGGYKCSKGYCECTPYSNNNAQKYVAEIKQIFDEVGSSVTEKVRGFATNVANYQPLGFPEDSDPCDLKSQYNFAFNEIRYMDVLDRLFKHAGINKSWITDTGRNGNNYIRTSPHACQQWCNIKGRLGRVPTSQVSDIQSKLESATLDALAWLKTPGESDGCSPGSGVTCVRVDSMCQRDCYEGYQKCPAPEAGKWDDDMIKFLMSGWTPNGEELSLQT